MVTKKLKSIFLAAIFFVAIIQSVIMNSAMAAPVPQEDSMFYYEIGGARAIHVAPNPITNTLTVGGSIEIGLGYSCGKFDPVLGVSNMLNDMAQGVENMFNALVAAAQSAIASLPMLILQRANPGLYDLMQTGLMRAEEVIALSTKSCEQMEAEIRKGKNPFDEWITLSKGNDWKATMGTGGLYSSNQDVKEAQEEVESNNGSNGTTWVQGTDTGQGNKAGGVNQPPISAVGDTAYAGYNLTLGQPADQAGAPTIPNGQNPRVVELWPTSDAARDWLVSIVGDAIIRTSDGGSKDGIPGYGLIMDVETEKAQLLADITPLVVDPTQATRPALENVSGPTTGITRQLLEAIRRLTPSERGIVVDRLAEEIAVQRSFEKAILMRRLLLTGKMEPQIIAAGPAKDDIEEAIARLEKEVENLVFEKKAQQFIVSETAKQVLGYDAGKNRRSVGLPYVPANDPNQLIPGGAINP